MQRIAVTDRRAALFAAAVVVIARDGINGTTTRAIAAEAGMPLASFHYVFASRDAMLGELVESLVAEQGAEVARTLDEASSVREFLDAALQGFLDRAVADPSTERALQELTVWSRCVPGLEALPETIYRHYEASIRSLVDGARRRFGVRWRLPEPEVARAVLVHTDGVMARYLVDGDEHAARRMLRLTTEAVLALADLETGERP